MTTPPAHGTRYRYRAGCTCEPCTGWYRTHRARQAHARALGRGQYTPAAPVRAHVHRLRAAGIGTPQIAHRSGVHHSSINHLLHGLPTKGLAPPKRILRTNATAILAVTTSDLADGARVHAVGAVRRAQALVAQGWPLSELARETGIAYSGIRRLVYVGTVSKATADKITTAYERLWDRTPAHHTPRQRSAITQARQLAARRDWPPPMAWSDDSIDDPAASPDLGREPGRGPTGVHLADVEHLRGYGYRDAQIADRLGVKLDSLQQALRRRKAS